MPDETGKPQKDEQIEFDHIILVCNGCKARQKIFSDRSIRSADELMEWMSLYTKKFCNCQSETCDFLFHIKGHPNTEPPKV